jgi:CDP-diacylglycerol pyrophosphatase
VRGIRALASVVLVLGCRPPPADVGGALWAVVSTCIDRRTAAFCTCPAFARSCCGDRATPDADVVWSRTPDFVAIRDLAMCGCPAGFVAGLALPRSRVTGIEDPRRPEGIWPFAWRVVRSRIADERQIALAINPKNTRSENQLLIHLLRLRPETRAWLDASDAAPPRGAVLVPLATLDAVFAAAEKRVGAGRIADTCILVARARGDGWRAVLTDRTSPQAFTINACRERRPPADQARSTASSVTGASKPFSIRLPAGSKRSVTLPACATSSGVTSSSSGTACSAMREARFTIGP